ncbi:hypothetical protein ACYJ1Y_11145 [Natrialbaceae archaeon A-gly3]
MTGRGRFVGYAVALTIAAGIVAVTTAVADDSPTETSIEAAIDETDLAIVAQDLTDEMFVLVGGSLALGLGIGIVVASGVTYAYKSREFTRRLE